VAAFAEHSPEGVAALEAAGGGGAGGAADGAPGGGAQRIRDGAFPQRAGCSKSRDLPRCAALNRRRRDGAQLRRTRRGDGRSAGGGGGGGGLRRRRSRVAGGPRRRRTRGPPGARASGGRRGRSSRCTRAWRVVIEGAIPWKRGQVEVLRRGAGLPPMAECERERECGNREGREREGHLVCSVPRNGRRGRPTAFCSSCCSSCWSVNSSRSFFILKMQQLMHTLLETV
jgi:hypothetical protein